MSVPWRRRAAAGMIVAGVVALVLAIVLGGGGVAGHPQVPGSGGVVVDNVADPAAPAGGRYPRPRPFRPVPAAVHLARSLPLAEAVGQLFVVAWAPSPGIPDVGGIVVGHDAAAAAGGVAVVAAQAAATARAVGAPSPFVAVSERDSAASGAPMVQAGARRQAVRLRGLGVNVVLAPAADVDVPGGALAGELFSDDPAVVARLSEAAVAGYLAGGVIPAVGHFPGEGSASADPDQMTASVGGSLAALEARDLVPFAAVAGTAPVVVMSNAAYTAFDGVTPAGLLHAAVSLLRVRYGFSGVVMSDDLDADLNPTGLPAGAVALDALRAGDDLLLITGPPGEQQAAFAGVLHAAEGSPAVRRLVRAALVRDLTLKARFGLLRS